MNYACPECGLVFGREEGYFTGAMIVSYLLAVPLVALLIAIVYFLPFVPAVFRYSRVVWMHFDRVVDPTPESERYLQPRGPILSEHDADDEAQHRTDPAA